MAATLRGRNRPTAHESTKSIADAANKGQAETTDHGGVCFRGKPNERPVVFYAMVTFAVRAKRGTRKRI